MTASAREQDLYWAQKLIEAQRSSQETVRKAAVAWSAVFSGVLGLFGTVTFVGGLTGLEDLSAGWQTAVRWLIVAAVVTGLLATLLSAVAANAFPVATNDSSTNGFRTRAVAQGQTALARLRCAMWFGLATALLTIAGSLVVLFADKVEAPAKPPSVITVIEGVAYCGELKTDAEGLKIGDTQLTSITSLVVVAKCP
jgi:hypothetical protein